MTKMMTAKYAGKCTCCGQRIHVGDSILWTPGAGAEHAQCPRRTNLVVSRSTTPTPEGARVVREDEGNRAERLLALEEIGEYEMATGMSWDNAAEMRNAFSADRR